MRMTKAMGLAFLLLVACAPTAVSAAASPDPDQCNAEEAAAEQGNVLLSHKVQRARTTASLSEEETVNSAEAQEYMLSQMQATEKVEVQPIPFMHSERVPALAQTEATVKTDAAPTASAFDDHWIAIIDKDLWKSTGVKQPYGIADGIQTTWGAAVAFVIDFGQTYWLKRIIINWRICKCVLPGSLVFQVSADKTNWFSILSPEKLWSYGGNKKRDYQVTASGRYLRIMPTKVSPLQWISMWEIQVYGALDARRDNVYGWYASYTAGTGLGDRKLKGTEMLHLAAFEGKLFAGNGFWMNSGEYQPAAIYRLDCAYCMWQSEGSLSPYVGRIEKLGVVTWTTAADGSALPQPVSVLAATYYMSVQGNGRCVMGIRQGSGRTWAEEPYFTGGQFLPNHFSARAFILYKDSVTGIDGLFLSTGKDGIIRGLYDGTSLVKASFPATTETGAIATRPLGLTVHDDRLYYSVSSAIYRRNDGHVDPHWVKAFDMQDALAGSIADQVVVDEAVGGIRGLTTIANPHSSTGNSLMFAWCPNEDSMGCIYRLDPINGVDGPFAHTKETCVTEAFSNHIGKNSYQMPTIASFSIAAYNDILEIKQPENNKHVHLIGFEVLLWGWSTHDLPVDTEQVEFTQDTGKRIAYYAGAGFLVRTTESSPTPAYEVRVPGGPRYDPKEVFPKYVAVRTMAKSPFNDGAIFMGGYDANHFPTRDTAWVLKGSAEAVWKDPVPCLPERGCGHTPGMPFTTHGCDLCSGRVFRGLETAYWYKGEPVMCQTVMNALNSPYHEGRCNEIAKKRVARVCCRDCNFCLGTNNTFSPETVAGKTGAGIAYTCATALSYTRMGHTSCYQATRWWKSACCK